METTKVLVLKFRKSDGGIYTLNVPDPEDPVTLADIMELANHIVDNEVIKLPDNILLTGIEKAYIQQVNRTAIDLAQ